MSTQMPKACWGRGGATHIYWKAYLTLWFDGIRTSQTLHVYQNKATKRTPIGMCISPIWQCIGITICITVGLSALLSSIDRAMRRPLYRGLGKGLAPRFLYVCTRYLEIKNITIGAMVGKDIQ